MNNLIKLNHIHWFFFLRRRRFSWFFRSIFEAFPAYIFWLTFFSCKRFLARHDFAALQQGKWKMENGNGSGENKNEAASASWIINFHIFFATSRKPQERELPFREGKSFEEWTNRDRILRDGGELADNLIKKKEKNFQNHKLNNCPQILGNFSCQLISHLTTNFATSPSFLIRYHN